MRALSQCRGATILSLIASLGLLGIIVATSWGAQSSAISNNQHQKYCKRGKLFLEEQIFKSHALSSDFTLSAPEILKHLVEDNSRNETISIAVFPQLLRVHSEGIVQPSRIELTYKGQVCKLTISLRGKVTLKD